MRVWRICRAQFQQQAWSGEGAWRCGGRWNSPGVRVVYTSTSLALAALETFVHIEPHLCPDDLVSVAVAVPAECCREQLAPTELPAGWDTSRLQQLRPLGDAWARSGASLGLRVPSAAVEGEWNLLLNPAHPDFARLAPEESRRFQFDRRMFAR